MCLTSLPHLPRALQSNHNPYASCFLTRKTHQLLAWKTSCFADVLCFREDGPLLGSELLRPALLEIINSGYTAALQTVSLLISGTTAVLPIVYNCFWSLGARADS